mgnify:CR=1 FL=1|tara:strand:- start:286 stop:471 length:186 start_codon:yes stop_codon:yes gene_type:complete
MKIVYQGKSIYLNNRELKVFKDWNQGIYEDMQDHGEADKVEEEAAMSLENKINGLLDNGST